MTGGAVSVYDIILLRLAAFALFHMPVMPPGNIVMWRGTVMDSNWPLEPSDSCIPNVSACAA